MKEKELVSANQQDKLFNRVYGSDLSKPATCAPQTTSKSLEKIDIGHKEIKKFIVDVPSLIHFGDRFCNRN